MDLLQEMKESTNKNAKVIAQYILNRSDVNVNKYPGKSLNNMMEYIQGCAKHNASNGVAMIEDEVVFGWAVHYFDEEAPKTDIRVEKRKFKVDSSAPKKVKRAKVKESIDEVDECQLQWSL